MEEKKQRGGKRPGAGRKPENRTVQGLRISKQADEYLSYFSTGTGISKNELADLLLLSALLSPNPEFVYCPKCKAPVEYLPRINFSGTLHLKCGHCGEEFEYNE